MRVFALSDIHVDYPENMAWIQGLSSYDYTRDVLLLAGDVCHETGKLQAALASLLERFARVFFVTGNHELWLLDSHHSDSLEKFPRILELCRAWGVGTEPAKIEDGRVELWIVPLFSWYVKPDEGPDSLFLPKDGPDNEPLDAWADEHFVHWPSTRPAAAHFLDLNLQHLKRVYDAPVISFSHFLPRMELLFPPEFAGSRQPAFWPRQAGFNFSRVAGTQVLDQQIRQLGSHVHAYGHQHRNRWVTIEGILYVSHCLGYPHERQSGRIGHFEPGPRLIWEHGYPAKCLIKS